MSNKKVVVGWRGLDKQECGQDTPLGPEKRQGGAYGGRGKQITRERFQPEGRSVLKKQRRGTDQVEMKSTLNGGSDVAGRS